MEAQGPGPLIRSSYRSMLFMGGRRARVVPGHPRNQRDGPQRLAGTRPLAHDGSKGGHANCQDYRRGFRGTTKPQPQDHAPLKSGALSQLTERFRQARTPLYRTAPSWTHTWHSGQHVDPIVGCSVTRSWDINLFGALIGLGAAGFLRVKSRLSTVRLRHHRTPDRNARAGPLDHEKPAEAGQSIAIRCRPSCLISGPAAGWRQNRDLPAGSENTTFRAESAKHPARSSTAPPHIHAGPERPGRARRSGGCIGPNGIWYWMSCFDPPNGQIPRRPRRQAQCRRMATTTKGQYSTATPHPRHPRRRFSLASPANPKTIATHRATAGNQGQATGTQDSPTLAQTVVFNQLQSAAMRKVSARTGQADYSGQCWKAHPGTAYRFQSIQARGQARARSIPQAANRPRPRDRGRARTHGPRGAATTGERPAKLLHRRGETGGPMGFATVAGQRPARDG